MIKTVKIKKKESETSSIAPARHLPGHLPEHNQRKEHSPMEKQKAVEMAYQIATLTYPSDEVLDFLMNLPYERTLELLLILRRSPRPVHSPLNFLRRAVAEEWQTETAPRKISRKAQEMAVQSYMKKGLTREEAEARYNSWHK